MCSVLSITTKSYTVIVMSYCVIQSFGRIFISLKSTLLPPMYIRWLCVDVNVKAVIVPPSTPIVSYAIFAPIIIFIIWSRELCIVTMGKSISTYSSKPSNSQWILFTSTSYTKLIIVEVGPAIVILLLIHSHLPLTCLC